MRLAAYAVLALLVWLTGGQHAYAQSKTFHRIIIDTTPIAESGTRQLAENIKPMLAAGVMRAMGGSIDQRDRNAPTLVITVKGLQLSAFGGSDSGNGFRFGGGPSSSDYLDTVVTIVQGKNIVTSFPILINPPSGSAGPWFVQPNEDRRVIQLGNTLGQWVRRKVDG